MLTKSQIHFLKCKAHDLDPVVMIGSRGLTTALHKEIDTALSAHELVKVRLGALSDDRQKAMIDAIGEKQHADFVQKIGHIALFYRCNPEKNGYRFPPE